MSEYQNTNNSESATESTMLSERLRAFVDTFFSWIWSTSDSGKGFIQKALRAFLRIQFIFIRELQRDRITLRASALTFTIVLSLVPVLALGTAVLKGLGAGDQMRKAAYHFIEQIEKESMPDSGSDELPSELNGTPTEQPSKNMPPGTVSRKDKPPATDGLTSHLRRAVDQIFDYVNRTDFATLGAFGVVGLVLAVLSVLGSIEQSMNAIWQTVSGRPFGRKLMDYLALIILLPITVNLALATETTLQSPALLTHLQNIFSMAWLARLLLKMLPLLLVVATFTILYRFIPNTRVLFFPAFVGGIFGGIGWLLVQMLYIKLQIGVARYNAIYGSFATLPLLLMWIYIGWVVFLAGAEMAFAAQNWRHYSWKDQTFTPIARLAIAFDIIAVVLADFHDRKVTDPTDLAQRLKQPATAVNGIATDLINGGLMRHVEGKISGYVPSAPEEEISPTEVIDLIFGTNAPSLPGGSLAAEALNAARLSLSSKKIVCASCSSSSDNQ